MVFIGSGGDIEGQVNPTLMVHEGETVQITLINGEGAEHDIVLDDFAARSNRVVRAGRQQHAGLQRRQGGRVRLLLLRAGPPGGGHGGAHPGDAGCALRDGGHGARDHPRPGGPAGAAGARAAARGEGRSLDAGARGRARYQDQLPVLDLQRPRARPLRARAGGRHGGGAPHQPGRQPDDPLGGFPRRHGPGRGCRIHPDGPRRREDGELPRADPRHLCLSLRHAECGQPHRQRHVWPAAGGARGRAAARRPRVLRDAGRDLHRGALWQHRPAGIRL